jgi:hypothetical protein
VGITSLGELACRDFKDCAARLMAYPFDPKKSLEYNITGTNTFLPSKSDKSAARAVVEWANRGGKSDETDVQAWDRILAAGVEE